MTLRRVVRVSLDRLAALSGLLTVSERAMQGRLTVLTFHRVLPDGLMKDYPFPSLAVAESMFRQQMSAIARRCDVVTVNEGIHALASARPKGRPLVAVTFDDGYSDNVKVAAPILDALGIRATFYVVAGLVGTEGELWYDVAARRWASATDVQISTAARGRSVEAAWLGSKPRLDAWMSWLKDLPPDQRIDAVEALPEPGANAARRHLDRLMTPDDLRGLQSRGHVVGSHTLSHPLLPQLDDVALAAELVRSRNMLEDWLQTTVDGFCYPNGDHDERVVAAVRNAGYAHACTTLNGRNGPDADRLRLCRIDMHPSRSSGVAGQFDEASFRASISLLHARGA